ncbi:MAG: bifunctional DNA-formamidopyrimidine glycosylase/DNA-(apurinic or apyrimidinic site) lyase [Acidiferrobacterales bacterium]|nr:bifunctional DNA-formamidopyrimidine glycosylase/DNA-(apurinic or apyrimidinic site) lyase [Acidiferrobacterales bacterium]
MPELPEVETTLRGIAPHIKSQTLINVVVRNASLRWPVPVDALQSLSGQAVRKVERIAKYILIHTDLGVILLHLGMSGSLRVLEADIPAAKHDHIDLAFSNSKVVRLNDPRRFGCCLLLQEPVSKHKLLASLGPEPLSSDFDGQRLFDLSRKRSVSIKNFIMDGKVVVGVGNIYASESLFLAGIRPTCSVQRISRKRYDALADAIKAVLSKAITAGGTTLNDFTQADGKPGYFAQELQVYGREGQACNACGEQIKSKVIGQRNTFYCSDCQT